MRSGLQGIWLAAVLLGTLSVHGYGQELPSNDPTTTTTASDAALSRNMMVSVKVIKEFFPAINRLQSSEPDEAPVGKPAGTRTAIYTTKDGSKKVILSVGQYGNPGDALTAYQETVKRMQVPELAPIAVSNVGQNVFAGILTQGDETRVSMNTLDGDLLVGATLSGFEASTENIGRLAELTRKELAQAKAHGRSRRGG